MDYIKPAGAALAFLSPLIEFKTCLGHSIATDNYR
jgi:hypothetical protein